MLQITLISHQHDDNVIVGVFTEFLEPALGVDKSLGFGDVVDEEGTDGTTVISASDCAISFLAGWSGSSSSSE